jgi:hypothetical protein
MDFIDCQRFSIGEKAISGISLFSGRNIYEYSRGQAEEITENRYYCQEGLPQHNPIRYEYVLTNKGANLKSVLRILASWGLRNFPGTRIFPSVTTHK